MSFATLVNGYTYYACTTVLYMLSLAVPQNKLVISIYSAAVFNAANVSAVDSMI